MASALVSNGRANIRLAKGAITAASFDGAAHAGTGELYWLATAKSLAV